jgi:hypothetical protein
MKSNADFGKLWEFYCELPRKNARKAKGERSLIRFTITTPYPPFPLNKGDICKLPTMGL